jgi:hypothetical protein
MVPESGPVVRIQPDVPVYNHRVEPILEMAEHFQEARQLTLIEEPTLVRLNVLHRLDSLR